MRFKKYIVESTYTNKIQGIPKNAFDYFNKYQKEYSVKELGFKKFNISKVTVSTSALSNKQRATLVDKFGFNNKNQTRELKKLIPMIKNKWNEIQKKAHMETYGEEPNFGSYKVSGIGDSNYSKEYKRQLRTLAHMETTFKNALIGHESVKSSFNEDYDLSEARGRKPAFGTNRSDGFSYAVNIPILDSNDFVNMPFGRQLDDARKVQEWKKSAKSTHVGSKGKATLPAVRKWVKENKPTEFYAKWKMDSSQWKDDSVEIFYN